MYWLASAPNNPIYIEGTVVIQGVNGETSKQETKFKARSCQVFSEFLSVRRWAGETDCDCTGSDVRCVCPTFTDAACKRRL